MRVNFNVSANNGIRLNNLEANDCAKWSHFESDSEHGKNRCSSFDV